MIMKPMSQRSWPTYRTVWRWHFFAGLFCIPFVIFLSLTGTIYLFKPQYEAWADRPYQSVAPIESHLPLSRQVESVLNEFPTAKTIQVELPPEQDGATRMVVRDSKGTHRVFVNPASLRILAIQDENASLMRQIKSLHGQLGIGTWGSYLVELAACWTVVMILTGMVLWWPKNAKGVGGILYPRWGKGNRVWWRDFHSVTGFWISAFAISLILTGLPWAKFWGNYFRTARHWTGTSSISQDWTLGGINPSVDAHAEHVHKATPEEDSHTGGTRRGKKSGGRSSGAPIPKDLRGFDQLHTIAKAEHLTAPVLISGPEPGSTYWQIASEAQNRPLRQSLLVDPASGEVVSREVFSSKHWIDRVVGIGIAAHEGQLFGVANQLLGLLTTTGLVAIAASGLWMWWRRREQGTLGMPEPLRQAPLVWSAWGILIFLAIAMPLFGLSLVAVRVVDLLFRKRSVT